MEKNLKNTRRFNTEVDDHFFTMHEYDIDYENNEIWLVGVREYSAGTGTEDDGEPGVEHIMAGRFLKNLTSLMKKEGNEPILIHMKSCGGHWAEGMAIYDAIKSCPNPVTILSYTHARSMSSLIFLAADKRVMMPHSEFMYHEGSMFAGGTVKQYLTEATQCYKAGNQMLKIYIDTIKKHGKMKRWSRERIKKHLLHEMAYKEEVYLSAKESVEQGFADEVFNGNWDKLTSYTQDQLDIE